MAQATYSIRLDQEKKTQFDEICEKLGLSASAALSTFVNKTIEKKGLPYDLTLEKTPANYGIIEADKLSREDLMAEIQKGVDSAEDGDVFAAMDVFGDISGKNYEEI